MINRTKVKESTQIKPGDNGDVLVMKDNAPEWSTPSDAGLAEQANVDLELDKKQDKLVAGDNIHIDGNTISADGKPTPINIGTVISGEVPMVSNSGTDTDVVLNFVLPKGDKGDPGKDGTQINSIAPLVVKTTPVANRPEYNLAIGNGAVANTGLEQLAVGASATCSAAYSTAVGSSATAEGTATTAVGCEAKASSTGGTTEGATVVGFGALTSPSSKGGIAIGGNSYVVEDFGTAIGTSATASTSESVAIGHNSYTTRDHEVSVGKAHGVSRPDNAFTRVISNVTDPTELQDAATKNYVDTKIAEIPTGTEINNLAPLTVDTAPTINNTSSIAIGNGAVASSGQTATEGIAIGENAYSGINGGTVIGHNARGDDNQGGGVVIGDYAFGTRGVNIGSHASVRPIIMPECADSIGSYAEVPRSVSSDYNYCVALGSYSVATEGKTVSVGSGSSVATISDDMTEEQKSIARASTAVPTRRIVNVTDPRDAQDAATKGYVDTQLTPINAKLQYVPENTNQILSQIQTNVEKAQSAADAKVASIAAGTGISVDASNPTAPIVSTTGLATQADLTALQTTVTQQAETIAQLQATVTQLQSQLNNLTLETEEI